MLNYRTTLIILFIVLLVTACSETLDTTENPTQLLLATFNEPPTLDPHRTSNQNAYEVFQHVCEPLVYQGLDRTNKPLLAKSWEMAPDSTSITFELRQDITFHDGTPFNAEAVKFTFERLQQPESLESPLHERFQEIKIETPDEYTVILTFNEPRPDFLTTLRSEYAGIISPTAIQNDEEAFGRNPVCTGPYQVKEWQTSQYVLLTSYQDYAWAPDYYSNQGAAKIDEIKITFVSDENARYLAFLNEELDILSLGSPDEVAEVSEKSKQFSLYEHWVGGISYLGFNYQEPPTNELAVRQALAHAIDKQVLIDATLSGMASPAFAPLAPSVFGFSEELKTFSYQFDPERSKELLAEAGFTDSDNDGYVERDGEPLYLEILTTTDDIYNQIFVLIQDQLANIGVGSEIRPAPPPEIAEITPTGDFDLLLYHYNWPFSSALSLFLSCERVGASNRVAYCNQEVDKLLERAAQLPDEAPEKLELLTQAQETILQDAPWQPLLVRKIVYGVNNRLQGIKTHPAAGLLLHDAVIVDDDS